MSLVYDTITIKTLNYNGTVIDSLYFNDTLVYKRAASIEVVYGTDVSSVKVDGVTIPNGGSFEYAPGDSKSIVVSYSGYVTGDGYVHSVNNNTTVNSTRWKYNTSYTIAGGLSKTVSVSSNLVAVSNTITFSLTDAEFNSLSSPSITFTAAKTSTQTYKSKQVSVPYTAYDTKAKITGVYKTKDNTEFNFDASCNIPDTSGAPTYVRDSNRGVQIGSIHYENGRYLLLKTSNIKGMYNVTLITTPSNTTRASNASGTVGISFTSNYTAYRNETQYYWE